MVHSPQVNLGNQKQVPNPKSKIRRRRTRRQTRVEVATNIIPDEEKVPIRNDNHTGGVSMHMKVPKTPKSQSNVMQTDLTQESSEGTGIAGTQIEEVEVTLADIELMNRRKHYHQEQRFSEMTGDPQYV